jgi:hypothetical protein
MGDLTIPGPISFTSGSRAEERVAVLLMHHGLTTAARHFELAEAAFVRGEWESANSQVRSYVEAIFEGVAAVRLRQALKRGHARKRLAEEGILGPEEAAVVQSVMSLTSGQGAHAGLSAPDEAAVRRLLGLAAALIGLSLLPELVRVEDVFATQLKPPGGSRLPVDSEFVTTCPTCGTEQTLAEAIGSREGTETVYECRNGCQRIVVVGEPGQNPWQGRGYRMGPYVIRNASDLVAVVPHTGARLLIPASPAALMQQRPAGEEA